VCHTANKCVQMSRDQLQDVLHSTRKEIDKVKDQLIEVLMTPQHDPKQAQQLTFKKCVIVEPCI